MIYAYILFFISGAAALVYEVVWARSLGLVFGASHLAVSTVLAVYMAGLALGSRLFAGPADRTERPLRLYGFLELGIAVSAPGFLLLMSIYPRLYAPLAGQVQDNGTLVTILRIAFAVAAMIVPTTLMGGTLPLMTRVVTSRSDLLPHQLSRLYALNTFGAVVGTLAAGFVLLRVLGATTTLLTAAATSALVGIAALLLGRKVCPSSEAGPAPSVSQESRQSSQAVSGRLLRRLTLVFIGVSGFCAMGYEVLWTRMLTMGVGTSVYSFSVMLAAFLTGIGLGSHGFSLIAGNKRFQGERAYVFIFAATQLLIGISALTVTILMKDLPATVHWVQGIAAGLINSEFHGRLWASAGIAFIYMAVPAFLMGMAFPAAGAVLASGRSDMGGTVGRLLAVNTLGAILGPLISGFVFIQLFGIERSLQMLVIINLGVGATILAAAFNRRMVIPIMGAAAVILILRGALPHWGGTWDRNAFATHVNNAKAGSAAVRTEPRDLEVLYYREGINETVSVFRSLGGIQSYVVNGRAEASSAAVDVQLQRSLGHLPMLLHPDPRKVFVLGTGTGMTLGATALHPQVERLVLAEIEQEMIAVGRSFARWNGGVLDDPRLSIVINDGRNYLATTPERFDVISADPIHPWSGGAGYLYTVEFFRNVAARLAPGGIASQWLPLYELSLKDVRTVVRTFTEAFSHTMIFLTYYDAVLVGSNSPLTIDPSALAARMSNPAIRRDLAAVQMGTVDDLLAYFVMGTSGALRFGQGGDLNTDDSLVLEFSAPESQGMQGLDALNVLALSSARESLAAYASGVRPLAADQQSRWDRHLILGRLFDQAHFRYLARNQEATRLLDEVEAQDPSYAPLRFIREEQRTGPGADPVQVGYEEFEVADARGHRSILRIDAVCQFLGRERALITFVNTARREIYGQRYIDGPYEHLDSTVKRFVTDVLATLRHAANQVRRDSSGFPNETSVAARVRYEAARTVGRISEQ